MNMSSTEKSHGQSCNGNHECAGAFQCVSGQCKCPNGQYHQGNNQCANSK